MDFYSILKHFHSGNRYLILLALLFVLFRSISGWLGKKQYEKADNIGAAALLGLAHLQLLLGLILYFISPYALDGVISESTDPSLASWIKYFKMEHIASMILAVAMIQVGRIVSKKQADASAKHQKIALFTIIATLLIVGTLAHKGLLLGKVM